ncbi:hypothetical protein [Haladaptatus sp. DJG-WS-42]|uniref:hypothetical protein n=1 Tax=Haladaptatus sp. DJG-WS-42 TaxID=3120516 RepID=UPI0030D05A65
MLTTNQRFIHDGEIVPVDWQQYQRNPHRYSGVAQPSPPLRTLEEPDTNNATHIRYQDIEGATEDYFKFKNLDFYNRGLKNGGWVNKKWYNYQNNLHLIEIISGHLELTTFQLSSVRHSFLSLNLREWGQRAELIAFCVCAVIVHQDETERSYHYNQKPENRDKLFSEVAKNLGLSEKEIRREYAKLENYFRNPDSADPMRYLQFEERERLADGTMRGI